MELLTISLGRNIMRDGSPDRLRMRLYAEKMDALHIIVLTRASHGYINEIHEEKLHIYPTHTKTRVGMLFSAFNIGARLLRQDNRIKTISAQDPFEIGLVGYFLSRAFSRRYHIQIHGDYFDSLWVGRSLLRRARQMLARLLFTQADSIRVVSKRIEKSLLKRGVPKTRITVLPIRPRIERFLSDSHKEISHKGLTFLTMGRLEKEKNIPLMIRAFAKFLSKNQGHRFVILGSGSEEKYIRTLVQELGIHSSVTFMSWTDDVVSVMKASDVYVLSSDHEAYALVLIEALAAGLPVITTDVGCVGEVVCDEIHGIVVPPRDSDAFTRAFMRMSRDVSFREKCSAHGRKTAQELALVDEQTYAEMWVTTHTEA